MLAPLKHLWKSSQDILLSIRYRCWSFEHTLEVVAGLQKLFFRLFQFYRRAFLFLSQAGRLGAYRTQVSHDWAIVSWRGDVYIFALSWLNVVVAVIEHVVAPRKVLHGHV